MNQAGAEIKPAIFGTSFGLCKSNNPRRFYLLPSGRNEVPPLEVQSAHRHNSQPVQRTANSSAKLVIDYIKHVLAFFSGKSLNLNHFGMPGRRMSRFDFKVVGLVGF